jgi:hypothetical protein
MAAIEETRRNGTQAVAVCPGGSAVEPSLGPQEIMTFAAAIPVLANQANRLAMAATADIGAVGKKYRTIRLMSVGMAHQDTAVRIISLKMPHQTPPSKSATTKLKTAPHISAPRIGQPHGPNAASIDRQVKA